MGYKIDLDGVVVSIWTNGFWKNMTIRVGRIFSLDRYDVEIARLLIVVIILLFQVALSIFEIS